MFVRAWWEISDHDKWVGYSNGGEYRKWFGNNIDVVDWSKSARESYASHGGLLPEKYWNVEAITWSDITSGTSSFREKPCNSKFSSVSPTLICRDGKLDSTMLAFLNSCVCKWMNEITNPTLHTLVGNILALPDRIVDINVSSKTKANISIAKADWDSYETSWDFQRHPLLQYAAFTPQQVAKEEASGYLPLNGVADAYAQWKAACEARFQQLKANEEELNRIFIDIYGLQDELTPEVADRDVTVHRVFDTKEDVPESMKGSNYVRTRRDEVVSLISYAVGCMFGRYSLDVDGLVYAGGVFSDQWIVVSGQLVNRKVVEECVGKELSRAFGMAEVDVAGGGDLPAGETAAERGVIWLIRPDEKGGRVGPLQYRRGTSKKLYEGICELSLDRPGFSGGIGNTVYDLCSPEILDAITNRSGDALVRRGWADAERFDW